MGDGYKVTLTRPDGSQINVDAADVEQFKALGYEPESAESAYSRQIQAAEKEHFESGAQKAITGVEGFVSGLTLGLPELSGQGVSEDARQRARYNPGTRLGSEIVGMILPSVVVPGSGAGRLLSMTPTGILARGAEAAAGSLTKTKVAHAVVRGAIEGGVQGASASAVNARLNGDPITAEAVVAGMGWGAVFGGGLSGVAGKFGVYTEKLAAERRVATELAEHSPVAPERWAAFRSTIDDARKVSGEALKEAASATVTSAGDDISARIARRAQEVENAQKALLNEVDAKGGFGGKNWERSLKNNVLELRAKTREALKAEPGNYAKFESLTNKHTEAMDLLAKAAGVGAPELEPFAVAAAKQGAKSIDELKSLKAISDVLDKFPSTPEGFAAMKPKTAEKQIAAVEKFLKGNAAELSGVRESVAKAVDNLLADTGLTVVGDSSPGAKLRGVYEASRAAAKEGRAVTGHGGLVSGAGRYVGGRVAAQAAGKAGGGVLSRGLAFSAGAKIVGGLLDMKSAVLGAITGSVHKWGPGVAKAGQKIAPRVDPLRTRLDGTVDGDKADRKQLMAARAKEIREAAPTIRDSIYRSVEPLTAEHTDLAVAMNKVAVQQFDALLQRLPRDPATAFSNLKSLWKPDFIETERFARAYEVFHNPVATAMKWLANPRTITPEGAHAMRDMNPELWTHLRVEMLNRLSHPGVLEKLSYSEQVGLGNLLDITIHSTQDPRFIKAQQEMFAERSQPLPVSPSASQNNSNNPSGVGRGATTAQRITEH